MIGEKLVELVKLVLKVDQRRMFTTLRDLSHAI